MSEQMEICSIGDLISALANVDQEAEVYIDNRPPTSLSSYRGYYTDLAIERSGKDNEVTMIHPRPEPFTSKVIDNYYYHGGHPKVEIVKSPKVRDLIEALELAIESEFEGYKGGQYYMSLSTQIWVSEYGDADNLRIIGLENLEGRVDLITNEEEW